MSNVVHNEDPDDQMECVQLKCFIWHAATNHFCRPNFGATHQSWHQILVGIAKFSLLHPHYCQSVTSHSVIHYHLLFLVDILRHGDFALGVRTSPTFQSSQVHLKSSSDNIQGKQKNLDLRCKSKLHRNSSKIIRAVFSAYTTRAFHIFGTQLQPGRLIKTGPYCHETCIQNKMSAYIPLQPEWRHPQPWHMTGTRGTTELTGVGNFPDPD